MGCQLSTSKVEIPALRDKIFLSLVKTDNKIKCPDCLLSQSHMHSSWRLTGFRDKLRENLARTSALVV